MSKHFLAIELDDSSLDNDLIQQPEYQTTDKINISTTTIEKPIIKDTYKYAGPEQQPGLLPKTAIGVTPDINASFTLVNGASKTIIDLKDIETELIDGAAISQENADNINEVDGSLYNRIDRREFTLSPSKINFAFTKTYLSATITKREEALCILTRENLLTTLKQSQDRISDILNTYGPQLADSFNWLGNEERELITKLQESKDLVIPNGKAFINILRDPVLSLNKLTDSTPYAVLQQAIALSKAVFKKELLYFLNCVITATPIIVSGSVYDSSISLGGILELIDNGKLYENVGVVFNSPTIKDITTTADDIVSEVNNISRNDKTKLASFLVDKQDQIEMLDEQVQFYNNLFNQLLEFEYNLVTFLQFAKTL